MNGQTIYKLENPEIGQTVKYCPNHARGLDDPACEIGIISRVEPQPDGSQKVWVRYNEGSTGALTPITNLFAV